MLMIKTHHKDTCGQRRLLKKTHKTCDNCCGTVIDSTFIRNEHGNAAHVRTSLLPGRHQALQLSSEVKHSLRASPDHVTDAQMDAMNEFGELIKDDSDTALLQRLGMTDARCVEESEMETLANLFSIIFFQTTSSDGMQMKFLWAEVLSTPTAAGQCRAPGPGRPYSNIEMKPLLHNTLAACGSMNRRGMTRLSALLHEVVHAYIQHYACQSCASYKEDLGQLTGHGRAWHHVANAVERAAVRYIGLPLALLRFESVRASWGTMEIWPTQKEVRDWELEQI
jgi:hypothetical protein